MKKFIKALIVAVCAALLVVGSITGTLAYLTAKTDPITNTFTAGKVNITLDEAKVTVYGVQDGDSRVKANTYKLIPGQTYKKDPVIHVTAGSENCYLFVKIENNIADVITDTVANQLAANDWTLLSGNVYYHAPVDASASATDVDVPVFESFVVKAEADNDAIAACAEKTIVVTAYAVQTSANFADAAAAWNATFGASVQS